MMTTAAVGGATRYVSTGVKRTNSADHTRPAAPACASQPAPAASVVETIAIGTSTIPATCASPISGIARKFSPSPAKVTRENTTAPIGNNTASAAMDAASIATSGRITMAAVNEVEGRGSTGTS